MSAAIEQLQIPPTDPKETPLDGTKGGALDPDDLNNNEPGAPPKKTPKPAPDIKKKIAAAMETIKKLKQDRAAINADISAEIEKIEALGINRHAFRHAMRYSEMSPEQRQGLDLSYALSRDAIGLGIKSDWIDDDAE